MQMAGNETEKITIPDATDADERYENTLRPRTLSEFVGQEKLKRNFDVFIKAARKRKEPLDHCLFYGPPGLGKTTLAHIISHELNVNIRTTAGPILDKVGDLAAILTSLKEGDVLFIDEIHRLNHTVEEALYPAMEDFQLDVIIGQGPSAKNIQIPTERFTLIGATTRAGLLTSPLRERFSISEHLNFYSDSELKKIVLRSGKILDVRIDEKSAGEIALRARGTPRIANRLLYRVRDFADVKADGVIDTGIVDEAMRNLEIDEMGLDSMDREILLAVIEKFSGGPVGIETLATAVSEEVDTITDVYEPFLIKSGFLARTPRGRTATENAYKHLNKTRRKPKQGDLL